MICISCGKKGNVKLCKSCGEKLLEEIQPEKKERVIVEKQCSLCSNSSLSGRKLCLECYASIKRKHAFKFLVKRDRDENYWKNTHCEDCEVEIKEKTNRCFNCSEAYHRLVLSSKVKLSIKGKIKPPNSNIVEKDRISVYFNSDEQKFIVVSMNTGRIIKQANFIALKNCTIKGKYFTGFECTFTEILNNTKGCSPSIEGKSTAMYVSLQLTKEKQVNVLLFG